MYARRLLALSAASLLAACSAGNNATLPSSPAASDAMQSAREKRDAGLELSLRIPHKRNRGHYISPSTQSIKIDEGTKTLGTFNTTPTTKGCLQQNGTTVCTYHMFAIPGTKKTFIVTTYDAGGAAGNALSTTSVAATIVANKANSLNLTLDGIETAIAIGLDTSDPTQGTPATLHLTVTATDADGNTIVGPGNFAHAISIANNNTGIASLGAATVVSPGSNVVTVAYNGGAGSATFTASATGVQNATAVLQSVKPHSQFVGGVYATVPSAIGYYNNAATPSFGLASSSITTATAVAVDDTGRVIAGDASGNINLWPLNATGTAAPSETLTGAGHVTALTWDAKNGRIIFAAQGASSFGVVAAGASGAISGGNTTFYSGSGSTGLPIGATISGLTVDPNTGTLYVANEIPTGSGGGSGDCPIGTGGQSCVNVLTFKLQPNGSYNYTGFIDLWDCTGYAWSVMGEMAFDPSHANSDGSIGEIWAVDSNAGSDAVLGFGTTSAGCNVYNQYGFTGDGANLVAPQTIAWDGSTGVWVGDLSTKILQHWTNVYTAPAVGNSGGDSWFLSSSPTNIASYSVYVPPALRFVEAHR